MNFTGQQKIRVGIIGCGHWGKNYLRIFSSLPGSVVSAVCDLDPLKLDAIHEHYPSIPAFADYREMFEGRICDAVVVSTIASSHYIIATEALQHNLHVLVEKPLTLRTDEADQLARIATERNRILFVAHTFLYNPSVWKIKEYIEQGLLGQIYFLKARRTHLGLIRKDVNVVWDLAPHDISIILYLLGELPNTVQAIGGRFLKNHREDVAFINLGFPSGIIANIIVSWADSNKERLLDIVGSKARIVFNDLDNLEPIRIFQKGISVEREHHNFGEFRYLLRDGDIISPKVELEEPLKIQCRSFLDSIQSAKPPLSDGAMGRDVVAVLSKIDESLILGSKVRNE
jgi:predicted dehydrogenase